MTDVLIIVFIVLFVAHGCYVENTLKKDTE